MSSILQFLVVVAGFFVLAVVLVTVHAVGSTYFTGQWSQAVREELQRLLLKRGLGRGLPMDNARANRIEDLLRAPKMELENDQDVARHTSCRLQGLSPDEVTLERMQRHGNALGARAMRRLADKRSAESLDSVLRWWRYDAAIEWWRIYWIGLRCGVPRVGWRYGRKLVRIVGVGAGLGALFGVATLPLTSSAQGDEHPATDWSAHLGNWAGFASVCAVVIVAICCLRELFVAADPEIIHSIRFRMTVLGAGLIVVLMLAGQYFGWFRDMQRWSMSAAAEVSADNPTVGGILVLGIVARTAWVAFRRARARWVDLSSRFSAGVYGVSLVFFGILVAAMLLDPGGHNFPAGIVFAWPVLAGIGGPILVGIHWHEHRCRRRALERSGIKVSRGWFRWWAAPIAILAPGILGQLMTWVEGAAPATPVVLIQLVTIYLVLAIAPFIVLIGQAVSGYRYWRRVKIAFENQIDVGKGTPGNPR